MKTDIMYCEKFNKLERIGEKGISIGFYLKIESENQVSSVEIMGRYVSEIPERKGTAKVWTSGSSSESGSSKTIGGAEREGPATGEGPGAVAGAGEETEFPSMASLTWAKIAGI